MGSFKTGFPTRFRVMSSPLLSNLWLLAAHEVSKIGPEQAICKTKRHPTQINSTEDTLTRLRLNVLPMRRFVLELIFRRHFNRLHLGQN
jgi:hypothetical protein